MQKFRKFASLEQHMATFLFDDVIFGPVRSRRLGLSLGINLLPTHSKYCSFNCIYCECGWTPHITSHPVEFPSREEVSKYLELRLKELGQENYLPQALTFAGNGEPTMHPDFPGIVDDTIYLRDLYSPHSKVAVLSNASMLGDEKVFRALTRIDDNIQKLDAGFEKMFRLMNNPVLPVSYDDLVDNLEKFNGRVTIQSMFLRGNFGDQKVDNTSIEEVDAWLEKLIRINPELVMIYSIARATPLHSLEKILPSELEKIAEKVAAGGLKVKVYG